MKQIINIWMQPIYARLNIEKKMLFISALLFPLLGLVAGICIYIWSSTPKTWTFIPLFFLIGVIFKLLILAIFWFFLLVQKIGMQYSPANAQLIHGLRQKMQWALILPLLLFPCLVALCFVWLPGEPSRVFFSWFYTSLVMLALVALLRTAWAAWCLAVLTQSHFILKKFNVLETVNVHSISGMIVVVFLIFVVVHWVFSMPHERLFLRQKKMKDLTQSLGDEKTAVNRGVTFTQGVYFWRMNKLCQLPVNITNQNKLFAYSLGPRVDFISLLVYQFMMFMVLALVGYSMMWHEDVFILPNHEDKIFMMKMMFFCSITASSIFPYLLLTTLYRTRGEQAIMSLTPKSGSSFHQTRQYVQLLLRNFILMWGTSLFVVWMINYLFDVQDYLLDLVYVALFSALPLCLSLVKNHAKTRVINDAHLVRWASFCVALFMVFLSINICLPKIPIWILCASIVLISLALFKVRWQALQSVHAVFPVGRAV